MHADPRLRPPTWSARPTSSHPRRRARIVLAIGLPLLVFYFAWLLDPGHVGNPYLYGVLVAAELFNVVQALGFWWTCARDRSRPRVALTAALLDVDVFVPVYNEPVEIVEPTIAAAVRMTGARVHVALLDDGESDAMRAMAARHGARYICRDRHEGAKAGNINHALQVTSSPAVVVLDCDHVPAPDFLEATLGYLALDRVAFVQTPQYYANHDAGGVPAASWAQQALFFGAIARGKDGADAMFCCGTNVVFRRTALEDAGGFPEGSVTEDFELSLCLHQTGWKSVYVPDVLASGLGPEDMASYVSQQHRWARGCLSALPTVMRARLPFRVRMQYLLSSMYFLSGWTFLIYMAFPAIRILTGLQPLAATTADQFLLHFAPYFGFALLAVAVSGAGAYTFGAFALQAANFWIHIHASLLALLRRPGKFVVTPKQGERRRQPRAVAPALLVIAVLVGSAVYGLSLDRTPATLNNVAFALLHVSVLTAGVRPALRRGGGVQAVLGDDERPPAPSEVAAAA